MKYPLKILFQVFIKTFYKENAAFFVFLVTIMFCIVNKVDGAGVIEYHYSLILGMLKSNLFLFLVFIIWLIYVRKISAFVVAGIQKPQYAFLSILNSLTKSKRLRLFLVMESLLLLPVLVYAIFIIIIGWQLYFYLQVLSVVTYISLLSIFTAKLHIRILYDPYQKEDLFWYKFILWQWSSKTYSAILLKFVFTKQKMICLGIKAFTCGIVFLIARNNTLADYDISFPFLFFNFGILSNGILVYRIREFEINYLSFYQGLPVPLLKRFTKYALVYFITLIPEFLTLSILSPVHIKLTDALLFGGNGYCLLLLMNSITFIRGIRMKSYLKILFIIFCLEFVIFFSIGLVFLPFFLLLFAILLFIKAFYKYEPEILVPTF
jgi:hypothetical protein